VSICIHCGSPTEPEAVVCTDCVAEADEAATADGAASEGAPDRPRWLLESVEKRLFVLAERLTAAGDVECAQLDGEAMTDVQRALQVMP